MCFSNDLNTDSRFYISVELKFQSLNISLSHWPTFVQLITRILNLLTLTYLEFQDFWLAMH